MRDAAMNSIRGRILGSLLLAMAATSLAMAQNKPVSRLPSGVPDFNGIYGGVAPAKVPSPFLGKDIAAVGLSSRDNTLFSFEADSTIQERGTVHRPLYRPEYWEKVRDADQHGNDLDPAYNCLPLGVPRMGPPQKIVQTANELVFLYTSQNTFRVIPVDGRPANEFLLAEQNWAGYSQGRWEGDTLVVETSGFTERTWLGWAGWIHSADMRVIERMWWQDGKLQWQATVHDETMLLEPFKFEPVGLMPAPNQKADLLPDLPCQERDRAVFERLNPGLRG